MQSTANKTMSTVIRYLLAIPAAALALVGLAIIPFAKSHHVVHMTARAQEHLANDEYDAGLALCEKIKGHVPALMTQYQLESKMNVPRDETLKSLKELAPDSTMVKRLFALDAYNKKEYSTTLSHFEIFPAELSNEEIQSAAYAAHMIGESYTAVTWFEKVQFIEDKFVQTAVEAYIWTENDQTPFPQFVRRVELHQRLNPSKLRPEWAAVLQKEPNHQLANEVVGRHALKEERFADAIKHLELGDDPKCLGYAYGFIGDFTKACEVLKKVVDARGAVLYMEGENLRAIRILESIEKPDVFMSWCLGNAYFENDYFDQAEAIFNQLEIKEGRLGLAMVYAETERFAEAIAIYESIDQEFLLADDFYYSAQSHFKLEEHAKGLEILEKGLERFSGDEDLLELRAHYQNQGSESEEGSYSSESESEEPS